MSSRCNRNRQDVRDKTIFSSNYLVRPMYGNPITEIVVLLAWSPFWTVEPRRDGYAMDNGDEPIFDLAFMFYGFMKSILVSIVITSMEPQAVRLNPVGPLATNQ
jgi:hypothetical protein